jgi:primosomal protein N'
MLLPKFYFPLPKRSLVYRKMSTTILKGMRLAVPFGKSRIYTALVVETHQNQPTLRR